MTTTENSEDGKSGTVYLLHFERKYKHAQHYLGWTVDLDHRLAAHRSGNGARLVEVITGEGIGFALARILRLRSGQAWQGGRDLERRLKRRKNSPRLCPLCRERVCQQGKNMSNAPRSDENVDRQGR